MLHNTGFTREDWVIAPEYSSPTSKKGVIVLDFDILSGLAEEEQAKGSFRGNEDGTLARAPIYIDDLPAAFYRISTSFPETTPNVNTSSRETIVVMDGVMRLVFNDVERIEGESEDLFGNTLTAGEVVELQDRPISMQAIGFVAPTNALALAMFRDNDPPLIPVNNPHGLILYPRPFA